MENLLRVGVITSAHGVRGEVKVFPTTDDNSRFKTLKHVLMDTGKEKIPLEIEHVKFFKNMVILKFKGFDNKNDVEMWRQRDLLITRDQAVELAPDENFIADAAACRGCRLRPKGPGHYGAFSSSGGCQGCDRILPCRPG